MSPLLQRRLAAIVGEWEAVGLRYTRRQLGYALCRRLYPLPRPASVILARLPFTLPALLAPERIAAIIDRYVKQNGAPTGLLGDLVLLFGSPLGVGPRTNDQGPSARRWSFVLGRWSEPDTDFRDAVLAGAGAAGAGAGAVGGACNAPQRPQRPPPTPPSSFIPHPSSFQSHTLPRMLLCADAELAAMLRANNLHQELACPILAIAEALPLPAWLAAMLAGGAQVALLHDASPAGMALAAALPGRLGLPADAHYRPIGLRPAHALRLHLVARRAGGRGDGGTGGRGDGGTRGGRPPLAHEPLPPQGKRGIVPHPDAAEAPLTLRERDWGEGISAASRRGESPLSRRRERGTGGEGHEAYPYPDTAAALTPAERRWLAAGWAAEAQAIPPPRLLRALKRIMADAPAPPSLLSQLRGARELGFMTWPG